MNTNEPVTGHRTQIYLPESLYRQIKESAQEEDISMARYIRKIIEKEISKTEKMDTQGKDNAWRDFFKLAGIGNSRIGDISINHDKYLAEALYDEYKEESKRYGRKKK